MKKKQFLITSGRGPAECMWVVPRVVKELKKEAENLGIVVTMNERTEGDFPHTLVSAGLILKGENLEELEKSWVGSIQWIGQSPYRKMHKRKNWFIEVHAAEMKDSNGLNPAEVQFQAVRSSGPGGQHVNKTSSAVRATHLPTGLSVFVQDSRSQYQNKKTALERLTQRFHEHQLQGVQDSEQEIWKKNIEEQRGNPIRVYEGEKFKRKK